MVLTTGRAHDTEDLKTLCFGQCRTCYCASCCPATMSQRTWCRDVSQRTIQLDGTHSDVNGDRSPEAGTKPPPLACLFLPLCFLFLAWRCCYQDTIP